MHRSGLLPAGSYHSNSSINSSMNSSLTLTNENYSKFALKLKLFELISQLETIEQKTLENIRKVLKLIKAESSDFIKQISELRGKFQNYFAELLANDLEQSTCTEIATATFPEVQADQSYYYISTSIKQFLIPSLRSNNKMPSEDFKGILMSIDLSLPIASPQLYSPVVNTSFKHQEYTVNNASYFYCAWWRESETSGPMVIDTINKTITPIEALRSSENPSISFLIIGNKTRSQQEIPLKCRMCEQISTEYFQCSLCISEICLACIEWVKNSKICKIQMVCHRNHPLRENEGCEEFYKIFKKKHPDYFICDGCLHETTGKSMHCRSCKVDYCEICAKKYQWLLENEGKNTCKKKMYSGISSVISRSHHLCENKLIWMAFKSKFSCYACKKYFPKSGNFSCTGCKRTLCIVCAYQRVNRN